MQRRSIIALCLLLPARAAAEQPARSLLGEWVMETWDTREGLPQSSIITHAETADGFRWFGTFGGLVRFDGERFVVFDRSRHPALPSDAVLRLLTDSLGRVWIATDRGLALLVDGVVTVPPVLSTIPPGLIESIVEDGRGRIVISGPEQRITVIDGSTAWPIRTPDALEVEAIDAVTLVTQGGHVFAERGQRLWVLGEDDTWRPYAELPELALALAPSRAGGLWVNTRAELLELRDGVIVRRFAHAKPRPGDYGRIFERANGEVWTTSHLHGVTRQRPGHPTHVLRRETGFAHDSTRFVYEEADASLWIGTDGAGLVRLRPSSFHSYSDRDGLGQDMARAALELGPDHWLVATHGGGLLRCEAGRFTHADLPAALEAGSAWVWALLAAQDGSVWYGTYGNGLAQLRAGALHRPVLPNSKATVRALAQDEEGTIWAGTESGLLSLAEGGLGAPRVVPLPGRDCELPELTAGKCGAKVLALLARRAGVLAGTEEGLWAVEPSGRFARALELGGRGVTALARDDAGAVWVALTDGHLIRWTGGIPRELGPSEGLPQARVRSLVDDGLGRMWLATNRGALSFPRAAAEQGSALPVRLMDLESGLPNRELHHVLRLASGELLFSGLGGLSRLSPARIADSPPPRPVLFERLRYTDAAGSTREVALEGDLRRLEVPAAPVSVELDVTSPQPIGVAPLRFVVELRGPNQSSSHVLAGRRFQLLHPAPGLYQVGVKAVDDLGRESAPVELSLKLAARFWQEGRFLASALAAALILVAAGSNLFYRARIRHANRRLAQEQRVRQAEARHRELIETSQALIWSLDAEGRWRNMTRATEQIYGASAEEMLGRHFSDLSVEPGEDRAFLARLAAAAGSVDHTTVHRRQSGGVAHLRFKGVAQRDEAGVLRGYAGTALDVTEEEQARREREQVQRKMEEAQRLESLGLLAGGVAHDFNNLLTTTLLNIDQLKLPGLSVAERGEAVSSIEAASLRAADLCRQMLAYSGRGRFQRRDVDLGELVESTVRLVRASASRDVRFAVELARPRLHTLGDPGQLAQVVMNLVQNAAEAIGRGAGEVRIQVHTRPGTPEAFRRAAVQPPEPAGEFLVLSVSDDGVGMPPETLERIFDPFFTTKATGRGLGLAAVVGIVRGHAGGLVVRSEPGRGSCFEVWLRPGVQPVERETPQPSPLFDAPLRALVIDDEAPVRSVLARMLTRRGVGVVQGKDGREGLELYRPGAFHVVFVDLSMPVMGGLEALQAILAREPGQRVVLMSGYDASEATAQGGAERAFAFLGKPFRLKDVDRVLEQVQQATSALS